jgi:SpoVK/Ycf46/Vps4 family AAA+-type ATPase
MKTVDNKEVQKTTANDSVQFYLAALQRDPKNVYLYENVVRCYGRERKFVDAWLYIQKALELGVSEPNTLHLFASICANWNEYGKALDLYNRVIDLVPGDTFIRFERTRTYHALGKYDQELKEYAVCLERDPKNTDVLIARAKMYKDSRRYEEAVKDLKTALKIKHDEYAQLLLDSIEGATVQRRFRQTRIGEKAVKEIPLVTFSDVIGLEKAKRALSRAIIYPRMHPELSKKYGVKGGGGVLLFGPPGCGKTFMAKAIAGEAKAHFMPVQPTDVLDQYVGNSEKNLHNIFVEARKNAPTTVFIDEIDCLGDSRLENRHGNEVMRGVVDTFLAEMDGVASQNTDVLVIGATNIPWYVDSALKRPGRFGTQIYVAPPNEAERAQLFQLYLKDRPVEEGIDFAELAKKTAWRASADIAAICDTAIKDAWEAEITSGTEGKVSMDMLLKVTASEKGSLAEWFEQASQAMDKWGNRHLYPELAADIERYKKEMEGNQTCNDGITRYR